MFRLSLPQHLLIQINLWLSQRTNTKWMDKILKINATLITSKFYLNFGNKTRCDCPGASFDHGHL